MKLFLRFTVYTIFWLSCNRAFTQLQRNIKFENISLKDGLSQSSPNCILQDRQGFLWIGTEDGLNKYDGYTFTVYKPEPENISSISNNRIRCLYEDTQGNIWIGTNGSGMDMYDRKQDVFVRHGLPDSSRIQSGIVTCIIMTHDTRLWVGTVDGLYTFDPSEKKFEGFFNDPLSGNSISNDYITCMAFNKSGLWIGTENGLNLLNIRKGTFTSYFHVADEASSLSENNIRSIFKDSESALWIGTVNGLDLYDKGNDQFECITQSIDSGIGMVDFAVNDIDEDRNGNIWIATNGGGLDIYNKVSAKFQNLSYDHKNPYSLSNNDVLSLFEDRSGIMWVGANGLDKYNAGKEKFTLYDYVPYTSDNLIYRHIHSIYEDAYGVLWIGSKSDGVHVLDRIRKVSYYFRHDESDPNSLSSNKVRIIREFPENTMWIGTDDKGLNKVMLDENRKPFKYIHFNHNPLNSNTISSNTVYSLYFDDDGFLWIGTDNGISKMNLETNEIVHYLPDPDNPKSLNNEVAYYIYGDGKKNIWIATDNGLNLYDPSTEGFRHYVHDPGNQNSLVNNELLTVVEDHTGLMWIGTYAHGMNSLDVSTGTFNRLEEVKELNAAVVYGILEDKKGFLWLSTNNGVLKYNPSDESVKQFAIEDGLQSNEFNGGAYFKSSSGEMFFGGQYGFNSFYPENVKIDTVAPIIVLTSLKVNNQAVYPGKGSPIKVHISEAKEIVFRHNQNNFTLTFAALHFANPSKNKYRYKLEGFDKDWIEAGTQRYVSYTRLPYRTFELRVLASNSDDFWNNKGLSVKIKVIPPFWATLWFRFLIMLIIVVGVVLIINNRINIEKRQKRRLEKEIEVGKKELDDVHSTLEKQREEITIQRQEIRLREKDQQDIMWFNEGLSKFSDIMSKNRGNTQVLLQKIISNLVSYVEAEQGGIYILNDELEEEKYLDLTANYAYPAERLDNRFMVGEGYVGTCFHEGKVTEVDNLERTYSRVKSGLGEDYPRHLALIPIKIDDIQVGVIELASFKKLKGYRISFVQKMSESLASMIANEKSSESMMRLVEQSRIQAEELAEQEEELRQNLEEMISAQEDASRREEELIKQAEEFATREVIMQEEIETLKAENEELKVKNSGQEKSKKNRIR